MKKNKLLKGIIIFTVTLIVGFGITMLSFNLFNVMTQNQMKMLFAVDVLLLIGIGAAVWFIFESGKNKKRKQAFFDERHNRRVERRNSEMQDIEIIIAKNNYAA